MGSISINPSILSDYILSIKNNSVGIFSNFSDLTQYVNSSYCLIGGEKNKKPLTEDNGMIKYQNYDSYSTSNEWIPIGDLKVTNVSFKYQKPYSPNPSWYKFSVFLSKILSNGTETYTQILVNDTSTQSQTWYEVNVDCNVEANYLKINNILGQTFIKDLVIEYEDEGVTSNGGGATHIAKVTGQLKDLSSNLSDILMVSGGGGGGLLSGETEYTGKEAGGISGSGDNSADQSTGNAFGQGESGTNVSGGGSGLYGGYKGTSSKSGGAGSGYIGNSLVSNKKMVGYNVPTSSAEGTKTESVNDVSASAVSGKPKSGNGFARIKLITVADLLNIKSHSNPFSKLPSDNSETDITDLSGDEISNLFTNTDILVGQKNAKIFTYDETENALVFDADGSDYTTSKYYIYLGGLYRFLKATFKYKKPIVYNPNMVNMTYMDVSKDIITSGNVIKENTNMFFNSDNQVGQGIINDYVSVTRDYSNDSRYITNYRNYINIVAFNGKVYIKDLVIEAIKIE